MSDVNFIIKLFLITKLLEQIFGINWTWQIYPNPLNDSTNACKRGGNASWICDPDLIMSRSKADKIEILLENIRS